MQSNKVMPSVTTVKGYCAVRLWSDNIQTVDYASFQSSPANCDIVTTDSQYDPMLATKNKLAPVCGYVGVTITITERIAK